MSKYTTQFKLSAIRAPTAPTVDLRPYREVLKMQAGWISTSITTTISESKRSLAD